MELTYVTETEHLELLGMADRAIGASVRLAEYLEAAGPDWKKNYLASKREQYRTKRIERAKVPRTQNHELENGNHEPENGNHEPEN